MKRQRPRGVVLSITFPEHLHETLIAEGEKRGLAVSAFARTIIVEKLSQLAKEEEQASE